MPYYYRPTKAIIFTDTELICIAFALGLTVSHLLVSCINCFRYNTTNQIS